MAFYAASIIACCALYIPSPRQPNDTQSWLERVMVSGSGSKALVLTVVQSVFGSLSDVYLLFLPLYSVSKLQLPFERKIGVCATFMVGLM